MAPKIEGFRNEDFSRLLEGSTSGYRAFLQSLHQYATSEGYLQHSDVSYLANNLSPADLIHPNLPETIGKVKTAKALLLDEGTESTGDLSAFYRTLRRQTGEPFGGIVSEYAQGILAIQSPRTHSILSQIIYLENAATAFFPELEMDMVCAPTPDETGDSRIDRLNRLRSDFNYLALSEIIAAYEKQSGYFVHDEDNTGFAFIRKLVDFSKSRDEGDENAALASVRALDAINNLWGGIEADAKAGKKSAAALLKKWRGYHFELAYLRMRIYEQALKRRRAEKYFLPNKNAVRKIPPVEWGAIDFSREVPSAQKVFFENEKSGTPLLVSVDPAPGNAYVASVSFITPNEYSDLQRTTGSKKAARRAVNSLRRPFDKDSGIYANNYRLDEVSLFVRRDGELCAYGDSEALARAHLGKYYDTCKKLAHSVLRSLAHTEYVTETHNDRGVTFVISDKAPAEVLEQGDRIIPTDPTQRNLDLQSEGGAGSGRAVLHRVGHSRLLPIGCTPSFEAWERSNESEGIELYAFVLEPGTHIITEKIVLSPRRDFESIRTSLAELQATYGDRIRFQTYVSEVKPENRE